MCNRFRLARPEALEEHFQAWGEIEHVPRFNVAPTQPIVAVSQAAKQRTLSMMRWQFIASWAPEDSAGHFNARSEKVTSTRSFADAIAERRCLIPADGFFEWRSMGPVRQPYCFEVGQGELFAFAGIWEEHAKRGKGCAILTTAANPLVEEIHNRMPVILRPDQYEVWLTSQHLKTVLEMLSLYDEKRMRRYPVSTRLNDAKNDFREAVAPIELNVPAQTSLFPNRF